METQVTESTVMWERRGATIWLTINRESRRNALNPAVISQLHAAVVAAAADISLRAIVLTGAGHKAFCAGADLGQGTAVFADSPDEPTTDFGRLARVVREVGIPLIARINGACVAGGMGLMSLCDLAIAADHAKFGLPEVKVGVFPMQVLVYLRQILGTRHLNQLCLTGELIDAQRAWQLGLVNQVVPDSELDAAVNTLVDKLAQTSPVAVRRGKRAIAAMEGIPYEAALSYAESQIALASRTDDAREGLSAFNEGRPPRWIAAHEGGPQHG